MTRLRFRSRLLLVLVAFAILPALVLVTGGVLLVNEALSTVDARGAWARLAVTGDSALALARAGARTAADTAAVDAHAGELRATLEQASRVTYLAPRAIRPLLLVSGLAVLMVSIIASRVAGHLSRQLSRPLDEVVSWTDRIAAGEPLPAGPPSRGAPEFETLRARMRSMATQLEAGRRAATEAARLTAFRETARRVAHELKNPLTPMGFALARLRADATPAQRDSLEVLEAETARLGTLARSFAQFGRLPDGPWASVDLGELLRTATRVGSAPPGVSVDLQVAPDVPPVRGHYDSLLRALSNVLLNAYDACGASGVVTVRVAATPNGGACVRIADSGPGIDVAMLPTIFDPYVTSKPGGTGLGLAIVRQTIEAHGGRITAGAAPDGGAEFIVTLPAPAGDLEVPHG